MNDIPTGALTERIQDHLKGRRLRSAVFTTFEFDPGFFEQEVLPALFGEAYSHAVAIRVLQLEDALKLLPGSVCVYYAADRLAIGDSGSGRLDVRRVPMRHSKGVFHPKNAFLLLEAAEPDEEGVRELCLVVATMSANLTRAGWWENLEAAEIELIAEGSRTSLRDELLAFLAQIRRMSGRRGDHEALTTIVDFLKGTEQRQWRYIDGRLAPQFYSGSTPFINFLDAAAGEHLRGAYLEVISPYFDDTESCNTLRALVDQFAPKKVRVYLPRGDGGEIYCRQDFFEAVRSIPGVEWGRLPTDMLRLGRSEDVRRRFVHAKVYRFFTQNPKREFCFVGSVNLTSQAHNRGNIESGTLVEVSAERRPEYWLAPEEAPQGIFTPQRAEDEPAREGSCPLDVRFYWDRDCAEAFWDAKSASPNLTLESRGVRIGELAGLAPGEWSPLPADATVRLKDCLSESSLLQIIREPQPPALVLVQEFGMSHKPSLLFSLTASDILRYWSLLTPAQRVAFVEAKGDVVSQAGLGADLIVPLAAMIDKETVFDRFAGIFHAFGCLEREALGALARGDEKVVNYRVFGQKYDSLGRLLDRIRAEAEASEPSAEAYVTVLCARQLCRVLREAYPDYWTSRPADVARIEAQIADLGEIRQRLIQAGASDLPAFLDWFDRWFLRRASFSPVSQ